MRRRDAAVSAGLVLVLASRVAQAAPAVPPLPEASGMEREVVEVLERARQAVLDEPESATAWGGLGATYHAHRLYDEAAVCYERALAIAPQAFAWSYFLAIVRESSAAALDEVAACYERAAALRPGYAAVHVRLGLVESRRGRLAEAARALERAVSLGPDLAIAWRSLGEVLLARGAPAEALPLLEQAARLAPADSAALAAEAIAYQRLGRDAEAREAVRRSRGLRPQQGIPDPLLEEQVESRGASARHHLARAQAYVEQERWSEALAELEPLRSARHADPDLWYLIGVARAGLGDAAAALAALGRALELKADHVRAHMERGRILEGQGSLAEAIKEYRLGQEISPRDPALLARLAAAQSRQGNLAGVIDACRKLVELAPDEARVRLTLGIALAESDEPEQAELSLHEALRLDPKLAEAHYRLGLVLDRLDRPAEAAEHYREAERLGLTRPLATPP